MRHRPVVAGDIDEQRKIERACAERLETGAGGFAAFGFDQFFQDVRNARQRLRRRFVGDADGEGQADMIAPGDVQDFLVEQVFVGDDA